MKKATGIIILISFIASIVTGLILINNSRKFDAEKYRTGGVFRHIDRLTDDKCSGRLTGSAGNREALAYIENFFKKIGVEPAGEDGTYYQTFSTLVPDVDTEPVFNISDDNGNTMREFIMYKDYKAVTSFNGGGVDFNGELLFVESNLMRIDPELIKDRVIVTTSINIKQEQINYIRDNGGRGLLNNADDASYARYNYHEQEKDVSNWSKTGDQIFVAYISNKIYQDMILLMDEFESDERIKPNGILDGVRIKVDMGFPIVETANILGKIEGKAENGRILMISGNVDGAGEGTDGRFFPGAVSNINGLSIMLETARVVASQDNLPFETIVFVGWNGQKQQFSGSEYYLEHSLYPPEKTTLIHLDDLGFETVEGIKVSSESVLSGILNDKVINIAEDIGIGIVKTFPYYGPASRFADYGSEAVMLGDIFYMQDGYYDNAADTDSKSIDNAAILLLNFLKRETYRDTLPDYLKVHEYIIGAIILVLLIASFIIGRAYKKSPSARIGKRSVEEIYYSTPVSIVRKAIQVFLPVSIAVFLLVFLVNIDPQATAGSVSGRFETNFSWYLTIKRTVMYFRGGEELGRGVAGTMATASLRSLVLLLSSLALSVITGIFSGMYSAYKKSGKNLRSLRSLVIFSIPDVLIVLAGVLLYVLIAQWAGFDSDVTILKKFVFPLITLSILPSIYITRMTYISIQEELVLDYVRNARAKGYSRRKMFISEILPSVAFRTVDALPAIMTMLISNMIIVEYLFNYLGILHYLIYFYNRQNIGGFTAMALILGGIYILLTWGVQQVARRINPLKRKVVK